ncbi:MAG: conjugal transfer protein TraX [Lachnospiraceae bacterium]|nr:conjugal transfer protein TraX [Lachnospiraceae bacterium]
MKKKLGISSAVLKWIAVFCMIIDHFACAVYNPNVLGNDCSIEVYRFLRNIIGRIAFPIYCYLLVEGFFHTKSVWKYLRNLAIFAVLSEIPFNMAIFGHVFYPKGQNVYFTLALGLCAIILLKNVAGVRFPQLLAQAVIIVAFLYLGEHLEVDYHWKGIAYIILFYYLKLLQIGNGLAALAGAASFVMYEPAAVLAFIPVYLYNGKRGRQIKYLFYAIYPLHLAIFGVLRFWLCGKL